MILLVTGPIQRKGANISVGGVDDKQGKGQIYVHD